MLPATPTVAATSAGHLVINEVTYWPAPHQPEWIELYNGGSSAVHLFGGSVSNVDGDLVRLPPWTLPGHDFLVVSFSSGRDDRNFSDGAGIFHAGAFGAFLSDASGAVALRRGSTVADFVAYSATGKVPSGPLYRKAVGEHQWPRGGFFASVDTRTTFLTTPVQRGGSIGRDAAGTDRNSPADWGPLGGVDALGSTPGKPNRSSFDALVPKVTSNQARDVRPQANPVQWTIMMLVDPRDPFVDQAADTAMVEMAKVGSDTNVNMVVQTGRHREYVRKGRRTETDVPAAEAVDPSDPATLTAFINWAKMNYPAAHYVFVLFGHGDGWKAVMRGKRAGQNALIMSTLSTGLSALGQ
jgi:hypothetical protein